MALSARAMQKKIILFELNEVPWRVINYFCQSHPSSNLAKIIPDCQVYDTYAEDTCLSPWITWPTVHRGVTNEKHGIHSFGQPLEDVDKEFPTIWQLLAVRGVKVGIFGSLHTYPLPQSLENYSFFLPDVFAAGSECFPEKLTSFQDFSLRMSRASARNVSTSVPWKSTLRFLSSLQGLGISGATVFDVSKQLVLEKLDSAKACRRRTYQVTLAFDIFMTQLERTKPDFTTFFTNHVASSMHRFWAAAFPDDYSSFGYSETWVASYRDEIMFTMSKFDDMLGRLLSFLEQNPAYELWIASSMGQAATCAEPIESQLYITDLPKLMQFFGIGSWDQRPAMAPDISLRIGQQETGMFSEKLSKLRILGQPINFQQNDRFFTLSLGHPNVRSESAEFDGRQVPLSDLGINKVVIEDLTNSSAYHIPTGSLMICGRTKSPRTQISTTDIFKAIATNYGIEQSVRL